MVDFVGLQVNIFLPKFVLTLLVPVRWRRHVQFSDNLNLILSPPPFTSIYCSNLPLS